MSSHPTAYAADADPRTGRTAVQKAALAVGVVFLLVGVLGFVPGITSDHDTLGAAGHESEAMLLGLGMIALLTTRRVTADLR